MSRLTALVVCVLMLSASFALAADAKPALTCTGTVVDSQGQPVAGATVNAYEFSGRGMVFGARDLGHTSTDAQGRFSLSPASADTVRLGREVILLILASKEGLSLGWFNVMPGAPADAKIALEAPSKLAGMVVDESGAPLAGAEVRAVLVKGSQQNMGYVFGISPIDALLAKTGPDGRFSFDAVPASATAEFIVSAPGMASIFTMNRERHSELGQFAPGQADIKITLAKEAVVEGAVVDKETGRPVAGVAIRASGEGPISNPFAVPSAVSAADGTFRLQQMAAGGYAIQLAPSANVLADWVAAPVKVSAEAGKTVTAPKVELEKGGILEVTVIDAVTKKPLQDVYVNVQVAGRWDAVSNGTNQDGIVQERLSPGTYKAMIVHKEGYMPPALPQNEFTIATGATERVTVELTGQPKLTGVVLDDAGKPLSGATVRTIQGMYGPPVVTGDDGKFSLASQGRPGTGETPYVFAVHGARNLAAVVPIEDMSKPLEIKMLPARGLKGRALDPSGKPIPGAKVAAVIWFGNSGSPVSDLGLSADASGVYEIKALPDGQSYSINVTAKGFGSKSIRVSLAGATEQVFTLEDVQLPIADKTISGTVVDADGKGVEGAQVWIYGENQVQSNVQSGKDGKFKFDSLVDGPVEISASVPNVSIYGSTRAKAGDTDVTIVVREQSSGGPTAPPKPKPLSGQPLPDLKSLDAAASWTAAVEKAASKPVLVVFFDSTQRPSRNTVKSLSEQAKDLAAKGVAVFCCDVSGAGADATSQWAAKAAIPFPVAAVAKPDDVQFAWGVQGLPWLILADKAGAVRSEGFQPAQLDAKLAEIAAK